MSSPPTRLIASPVRAILALAIVAASAPSVAVASPADEGEERIKHGIALRRQGDDQSALSEFQKAFALSKTPRAAAQLGLCEQALGKWADAEGHMVEALAAKNDPWIKKNLEVLEKSLGTIKGNVARIEILGSPIGAEVSISGQSIGNLPLSGPVRVNSGPLDIEVALAGYKSTTKSLQLRAGEYQRVLVRLEPVNLVTRSSAAPPSSERVADLQGSDFREDRRPILQRPWVWVIAGVAVAAGVAAIVLATSGGNTYPDAGTRRPAD